MSTTKLNILGRKENSLIQVGWHTRIPNAPKEQDDSWAVQRDKTGIGYEKMLVLPVTRFLLEKTKWCR